MDFITAIIATIFVRNATNLSQQTKRNYVKAVVEVKNSDLRLIFRFKSRKINSENIYFLNLATNSMGNLLECCSIENHKKYILSFTY